MIVRTQFGMKREDESDEFNADKWVTMHGTHMEIGKTGAITKGPNGTVQRLNAKNGKFSVGYTLNKAKQKVKDVVSGAKGTQHLNSIPKTNETKIKKANSATTTNSGNSGSKFKTANGSPSDTLTNMQKAQLVHEAKNREIDRKNNARSANGKLSIHETN